MLNTTLADIVTSAQLTGQKVFKAQDLLAAESIKLEDFATTGFDRADYPTWEHSVDSQVETLKAFSVQPSPATVAARKAAAATPAEK